MSREHLDTWLLEQTKDNMYGLDRARQKTESYTGIVGIPTQDRAMTEGMGYICDRTDEHLGTTDVAVMVFHRGAVRCAVRGTTSHRSEATAAPER